MRRGYSLLEIMLVLALLVIVAGLTTLSIRNALEGQRLRKSGDQVRVEWAKARNHAMRTGRIYVFRYKVGLDEYETRPWYAADDELESSSVGASGGLGNAAVAQPAPDSALSQTLRLPEGVLFSTGETVVEARSAELDEAFGAQSQGEWSTPILFYPDGTSSTARLVLTNRKQQLIALDLRGLTGLAQVSDLLSQQELSQ